MQMQKIIDRLYYLSIDHFVNYRRHIKEYFFVSCYFSLKAISLDMYLAMRKSFICLSNLLL